MGYLLTFVQRTVLRLYYNFTLANAGIRWTCFHGGVCDSYQCCRNASVSVTQMRGMASGLITCFDEVGRGAGGYVVAYLVRYLHGREAAFVAAFTLWGGGARSA